MELEEGEEENFTFTSLAIEPELSAISDPVKLTIGFTAKHALPADFRWRVSYMVDTVMKRQILRLCETEPAAVPAGEPTSVEIQTPELDVEGVKRKHLLNVGLLMVEGLSGEKEEVKLNMVVQVSADKETGGLRKLVISPLDG